ncbi:MAG: 4Fe-4S binding protein [Lachnospiraceae bacterium]|jgi:NAD-dependent dihydropyrimidine dehydrogenase PreA subunit|nr:4Fe-4S binding protein [Lachnospiraceae bacterium]MCI8995746.1 4Fe-4S binding protein [Lachnospiraceae bacterium]MCI9134691.1 4Fe-4S binding protein [Lachnospiraceae bacterium]
MIFYFSGTGNSQGLAKIIAKRLGDEAKSIVDLDPEAFHFSTADNLGFVFPIYAYAAPEMMIEFARRVDPGEAFTFAVCTFSNVTGDALEHFSEYLPLKSGYGIKMPDNFPVLDRILETEESAFEKLCAAKIRLEEILPRIQAREEGVFDTLRGEDGHNRSYKGYTLFNETMRKTAPYWVEQDLCTGCGLCAKLCPAHAIEIQEGIPVWVKEDCCMCMSCLNRCPREAVQFGEYSRGRFRYSFRGFDLANGRG